MSGNAVVTIDGTTYDGVYVNALNLSENASATVNAAGDNAIYGDISVADTATPVSYTHLIVLYVKR